MHKMFTAIRAWFEGFLATEVADDPLAGMGVRELADLPAHHPR